MTVSPSLWVIKLLLLLFVVVVSVSCSEVSVNHVDLLHTKARYWPWVYYENLVEGYAAKEIIN